MSFRYRAGAALMLATCVASCGDSNPFLGKWEAANNGNPDTCAKSIIVTDKSYRSDLGIWLYTLVEDGDDYIIDRNNTEKIQATVEPDDTVTLNFGRYQCRMQHKKNK